MNTTKRSPYRRKLLSIITGNILEHYDQALYALLGPILAPLFFPEIPKVTQLILIYSFLPAGFLLKPLGAIYWSKVSRSKGTLYVLRKSLTGMGFTCLVMFIIPEYSTLGLISPLLLLLLRMIQSFFAAAETTAGVICSLEITPSKRRSFISSCYDSSTVIGIFLASILTTLLLHQRFEAYWRVLYLLGGMTALAGTALRSILREEDFKSKQEVDPTSTPMNLKCLIKLSLVSGMSYLYYHLAFTFTTQFIPIVSSINLKESYVTHCLVMGYDILLLPLMGTLAQRIGIIKQMVICLMISMIFIPFWFLRIEQINLINFLILRIFLVTLGVGFSAAIHHWKLKYSEPSNLFLYMSLSSAIGSQWIGAPFVSLSLFIYKLSGLSYLPAIIPVVLSIFCLSILYPLMSKDQLLRE